VVALGCGSLHCQERERIGRYEAATVRSTTWRQQERLRAEDPRDALVGQIVFVLDARGAFQNLNVSQAD
jgi:hypothetical protein